jgi:hypothetical protein
MWSDGGNPTLAELQEAKPNIVGRSQGSDVLLQDRTISRKHAVVRVEDGVFVLENVSETNVAKVNGVAIERPVPLSDGDSIELGALQISFHDLHAGDRVSGPMCSHCSRENMPTDKDCWYCGTSLVNAPTAILEPKRALCRLVSEDGESFDIHQGEAFVVASESSRHVVRDEELPPDLATGIRPEGGKSGAVLFALSDTATVNEQPSAVGRALSTGDRIDTQAGRYTIIVR